MNATGSIGRNRMATATAPMRPTILGSISIGALDRSPLAAATVHLVTSRRRMLKLRQVSATPIAIPSAMSRGWVSAEPTISTPPIA